LQSKTAGELYFSVEPFAGISRKLRTNGRHTAWDQSNKNYILTHGVSGVDWRFYKHPLPEHVYDLYMKYRKDVNFAV